MNLQAPQSSPTWQDVDLQAMAEYWNWQQLADNWEDITSSSEVCHVCDLSNRHNLVRCHRCGWQVCSDCRSHRKAPHSGANRYDLHHAGCQQSYDRRWFDELNSRRTQAASAVDGNEANASSEPVGGNAPVSRRVAISSIIDNVLSSSLEDATVTPNTRTQQTLNLQPAQTRELDESIEDFPGAFQGRPVYYVKVLNPAPRYQILTKLPGFDMRPIIQRGSNRIELMQPTITHAITADCVLICDTLAAATASPLVEICDMASEEVFEPPSCNHALNPHNTEFKIIKTTVLQVKCKRRYRASIYTDTIIFYKDLRNNPTYGAETSEDDEAMVALLRVCAPTSMSGNARRVYFQELVAVEERDGAAADDTEPALKRSRVEDV